MKVTKKTDARALTPRLIYEHLNQFVVGQEHAKRTLSIAAYNHNKRCSVPVSKRLGLRKSNVLLVGPTGCGKTYLVEKLAEKLDLPLVIVDATEYTEAGYHGKDVEAMIADLFYRANHSVEKTEKGIIFIDEIDKIAKRGALGKTSLGSRDIGGEGVQQSLLKLLEGRELFVPLQPGPVVGKQEGVKIDTTHILFIVAGAFDGLFEHQQRASVGFNEQSSPKTSRISPQALIDYGMIPEFLGRIAVIAQLDPLTESEMYEILCSIPNSLVDEYQRLLSMDGVELCFEQEALLHIAQCASNKKRGARELRTLMEAACHDVLFEAPERSGQQVLLTLGQIQKTLGQSLNMAETIIKD